MRKLFLVIAALLVSVIASEAYWQSRLQRSVGVSEGPSISGAVTLYGGATTTINLTNLAVGTGSDWAAWSRSTTPFMNRKATGGSLFSTASAVNGGAVNQGGAGSFGHSWSDGTPDATATNENNYIWNGGGTNYGLSFTVPASTTSRTLYVYAGLSNISTMQMRAHLNDSSASDYTDTSLVATVNGYIAAQWVVTYRAGTTTTLTVSFAPNNSAYVAVYGGALVQN